jgi:hypothetical protein
MIKLPEKGSLLILLVALLVVDTGKSVRFADKGL